MHISKFVARPSRVRSSNPTNKMIFQFRNDTKINRSDSRAYNIGKLAALAISRSILITKDINFIK